MSSTRLIVALLACALAGALTSSAFGHAASHQAAHIALHRAAPVAPHQAAHVASHQAAPVASRQASHAASRQASHVTSGQAAHVATVLAPGTSTVLSPTPYMGWDTYFAYGGRYTEATVLEQASEMLQLGLVKLGYRYVWLDVGWWHGQRNKHGQIAVSHKQWPHGIRWLASTLHAAGLQLGVYTDAGKSGCGGAGQGSFGHYTQDINTLAAWGVDAVKVDFCGGSRQHLNPTKTYGKLAAAIEHNSSRHPMLLSVCDFLQPGRLPGGQPPFSRSAFSSYAFARKIATSWRTDTDVGQPGSVLFSAVLRNINADAANPQAAGPGHWNDPDYLGPGQGLTGAQFRTQFSMWAILAAPLMVSDNLATLDAEDLQTITSKEAIAIDQDPAGVQGTLVASGGQGQVWVKPLSDGSRAIALLNRGSAPLPIVTSAAAIGLPSARSYVVRNIWEHATSSTSSQISALVPGESTVLLRVRASR